MLDHIAHALLALLMGLVAIVLSALGYIENALGHAMSQMGLPHTVQTVLGIFVAVLILVAALRLFGGFIRVVLIVVVLALVVHAVTHNDYESPQRVMHL
jgi:TRAP-type uncharacterized transport system fused permease subunit